MPTELSIIVPAFNAQDVVSPLIQALGDRLPDFDAPVEVIVVDDGSADLTMARVRALLTGRPWLRLLRLARPEGKGSAIAAGIRAANGTWIALMEADLEYDLHDLVAMWARARRLEADWFQGRREPPGSPSLVTRLTRPFERLLLADETVDPGCPVRVFRASIGPKLPFHYRGLLRFLPVYAARLGYSVKEHPVRWTPPPPTAGRLSAIEQLTGALIDLLAVRWMFARVGDPASVELRLPVRNHDSLVHEERSGTNRRATATLPPPDRVPTGPV